MNQPLVSVALCTYNGAAYLEQQLETIVRQTYANLEIVIVDDASTDNTQALLKSWQQKDNRVRVYFNDTNLGFNQNFEKAIGLCTGEYIAISDQDDIWEPNKIEKMMAAWPQDCAFIYSLSQTFSGETPDRTPKAIHVRLYEGSEPHKLYFDSPVHGHACMFRKSLLHVSQPFPPNVFYDWWLSVVASSVSKVCCVPLLLTHHRSHAANSSRDLVRIEAKEERLEKLRQQRIEFIKAFLERDFVQEDVRRFSQEYLDLLQNKKDHTFSLPLFWFFLRNRDIVFHYKKKRSFISMVKHSIRRAKSGL